MFSYTKTAALIFALSLGGYAAEAWILCDTSVAQIKFCFLDMQKSLAEKGYGATAMPLSAITTTTAAVRIIVAPVSASGVMNQLPAEGGAPVGTLKPQGYAIRITGTAQKSYWIIGGDVPGAMYGGLDFAENIAHDGLSGASQKTLAPYLDRRGIKINLPLDARQPSFSCAGQAAWDNVATVWDFEFWKSALDDMARNHYNVLSIWNLSPLPSMVKVAEYPNAALADVKRHTAAFSTLTTTGFTPPAVLNNLVTVKTMSIDDKIIFWKKVMAHARDRGIGFYVYVYSLYTYGMTGDPRITPSSTDPETKDYLRKATRELVLTYPDLAGIGITNAFNQPSSGAIQWLYDTYGAGIADARAIQPARKVRLTIRMANVSVANVMAVFGSYPDTLDFSDKYAVDHMYSSLTPNYVANNLSAAVGAGKKFGMELRNNDVFAMRWGDPDYVRAYFKNIPQKNSLWGYDMGSDGYTWGREINSTEPDAVRQSFFAKHWYGFMLWGRMGYDSTISNSAVIKMLGYRFPQVNSSTLLDGWSAASKIIPLIVRYHWSSSDLDWFPEACYGNPTLQSKGFHSVRTFIDNYPPMHAKLVAIPKYAAAVKLGQAVADTTPLQVAQALKNYAALAHSKIAAMGDGGNKELRLTLGDIRAQAYLGNYYAEKIIGATWLCLYEVTKSAFYKDSSIAHLRLAAVHWRLHASAYASQYNPEIFCLQGLPAIDRKALMANVLNDIVLAGGSAKIASSLPTAGGTILEAESASIQGGSVVRDSSGNTGAGYVDYRASPAGSLQWTFNAPKAGLYTLEFRYAQDNGEVPVTLTVNGAIAGPSLSFWTTGGTSIWQVETRTITLAEGNTIITLRAAGKWAAVDHLNIVPIAATGILPGETNTVPSLLAFMRRGRVQVNIQVFSASTIECTVFNSMGRMVLRQDYGLRNPGFHEMTINTENLRAGCYCLAIKDGTTKIVRKITITR